MIIWKMYSLVGLDNYCVMLYDLNRLCDDGRTAEFAVVPIKRIGFPIVKMIGLMENEEIEQVKESRLIKRAIYKEDQVTAKWELEPRLREMDGGDSKRCGYGKVYLTRNGDDYLIKVEVNRTWSELSFRGDRAINYHIAFECDKGSMMLLGTRDLTLYLCAGTTLKERPQCPICHHSKVELVVFSCGHNSCHTCILQVHKVCKACPVCQREWKDGGGAETVERGRLHDEHCSFDDCMEYTVVNLPCRCITCDSDKKNCARCRQPVTRSLPFFY
ncbi:hypothetical protein PFISCL1PPCAC_15693 [Pristionchus fissidentatus]|uniref:RING-type domain-containing protein n=1 Tax=Pristionchus fissidentatus TaxID=1538716 RepID=A0AAV5W0W2_9BILA|nr:hypothetical protein PFISCL1PPCAC_15693 [Pristionchus fissidentatus]